MKTLKKKKKQKKTRTLRGGVNLQDINNRKSFIINNLKSQVKTLTLDIRLNELIEKWIQDRLELVIQESATTNQNKPDLIEWLINDLNEIVRKATNDNSYNNTYKEQLKQLRIILNNQKNNLLQWEYEQKVYQEQMQQQEQQPQMQQMQYNQPYPQFQQQYQQQQQMQQQMQPQMQQQYYQQYPQMQPPQYYQQYPQMQPQMQPPMQQEQPQMPEKYKEKTRKQIKEFNTEIGKYIALYKIIVEFIAKPKVEPTVESGASGEPTVESEKYKPLQNKIDELISEINDTDKNCGIDIPQLNMDIFNSSENLNDPLIVNAMAYLVASGFFLSLAGGYNKNKNKSRNNNKNNKSKKGGFKLEEKDVSLLKIMCVNLVGEMVKYYELNKHMNKMIQVTNTSCDLTPQFKELFTLTNKLLGNPSTGDVELNNKYTAIVNSISENMDMTI